MDTERAKGFYDLAVKIVFPVLVGVCSWGFMSVTELDKRLSLVELQLENDHKNDKARDVQREAVSAALGEIKEGVVRIGTEQKATQDRLGRIEDKLAK